MKSLNIFSPKTVAAVCDLDKVIAKLQSVADEQTTYAYKLSEQIAQLSERRATAFKESMKANKIIAGINNLLGL